MSRTQPATLVFGAEVHNEKGGKVGQVEDLAVDLKNGHVIYAVISFFEETGLGNRYYPIPIKALKEKEDKDVIYLAVHHDQLQDAPSFKAQKWPKEYNEKFVHQIYDYYGYEVSQ